MVNKFLFSFFKNLTAEWRFFYPKEFIIYDIIFRPGVDRIQFQAKSQWYPIHPHGYLCTFHWNWETGCESSGWGVRRGFWKLDHWGVKLILFFV